MTNPTSEHIGNERLRYLFERYMGQEITATEEQELAELSLLSSNLQRVTELEQEYWEKEEQTALTADEAGRYLNWIFENRPAKIRTILWRRIAVAASIVFVLGLGAYFAFFNKGKRQDEIVKVQEPAKDVKAPETNRAMIKLADGRTVYLDSANNGELALQGNIKLVKLDNGQIAYQTAGGEIVKELQYNTLSNPRGSKVIDMTFSDGSRVWLNAGSSVTYPIAFVGNERKVTITGEAYFEIAHDASKPFRVSKGETRIEVLGTHFNVNAYDDEDAVRVTLLEGSVKVSNDQSSLTIKPNQQAVVKNNQAIELNKNVNIEEVMAWKNGLFQFGEASIEEVMRQVARWYDVEVVYESKPTEHFRGEISRSAEASKVLKMLEATEAVHFRIEGKKIFVGR